MTPKVALSADILATCFTNVWETGDRRDVSFHVGRSKSNIVWFRSEILAGRPPFRGVKGRAISSSNFLTNSSEPKGRPLYVHLRRVRSDERGSTSGNSR